MYCMQGVEIFYSIILKRDSVRTFFIILLQLGGCDLMASKDQQRCRLTANVCVASWDRSRDLRITRKASWPLTHRGALFLVNPGVIELLHSPPKSSVWRIFWGDWSMTWKGKLGVNRGVLTCSTAQAAWPWCDMHNAHHVGITSVAM